MGEGGGGVQIIYTARGLEGTEGGYINGTGWWRVTVGRGKGWRLGVKRWRVG